MAGCQSYLEPFTWRNNSILNFLANSAQTTVNNSNIFVDLPGFKNPSILTGDSYRPDLLISSPDGSLYAVELTVGYETNLHNNVKRKEYKYRELIQEQRQHFSDV